MRCPICLHEANPLRDVDGVEYFKCLVCGSLFAHPEFLAAVDNGAIENYRDAYWKHEVAPARERSFGAGVVRMAETLRMARMPIRRALDIGSGPGFLLDALAELVPSLAERVHGVERYPPPARHRSRSPNYHIGSIADLDGAFDVGVCIEVIEHLTPALLASMLLELAGKSNPGALYFFNSAQPSFVETANPGYLSPYRLGHIVSWSVAGARLIFERAGFNLIALPGRDWAFLAEFGAPRPVGLETLADWLESPAPENIGLTRNDRFGPLFEALGLESARCYLETAIADERMRWAQRLQRLARRRRFNPFARE